MRIDMHHHAVPETLLAFIRDNQRAARKEFRRIGGETCLVYMDNQFVQPVYPVYYDDERRFSMMEAMGLDMAVLSISPAHFNYELEPSFALETSQIINDWIGQKQRAYPGRYLGMMTIPMQAPELALAELTRAHTNYGMRGLVIGAAIGAYHLDNERFFNIYAYCAANHITLCLHPYFPASDPAFARYYTANLVRFPLQTCLGLTHLLLGGVLERLPGLNVVACHGGGYFPYQFGRLEHGYAARKEAREGISSPPSKFLPQVYYDTITHAKEPLQFLVDTYGPGHVLMGTDMPYDMGDARPVETVGALRLTSAQREGILGGNASKLFAGL